jgi:hypothetical protein
MVIRMKPRKPSHHTPERRRILNRIILVILVAVMLLLLIPQLHASDKQLTADVDRTRIEMGDVLKLKVQTNFETTGTPDFSQLQDQFEILGRQRSSRIEITNGRYKAFSRWDLHLSPRQQGELVIPPFEVDDAISAPLTIEVRPPSQQNDVRRGASFVESFVEAKSVYVQQQVHYTLRFYHLGQFINGNIRPPRFDEALSFSLRNQFQYQKQIGAHRYEVYEWTWVFYPQKSGTYTLPPQGFDGRIQYRGQLRLVQDRTQPIQIEVKPIPDAFPASEPWLPAQSVQLTQQFDGPRQPSVGETVQRTLTLRAKGLLASQLPEVVSQASEGLSLYPKKPALDNQAHQQTVISERQQTIEAVANASGAQRFAPITLHWWNTDTDQLETLTLPERRIEVSAAVGQTGQVFLPEATPSYSETSRADSDTTWTPPKWWFWGLVPLLLAVLFLMMRYRQPGRQTQTEPSDKPPSKHTVLSHKVKQADRLCDPDTLEPTDVYRQLQQRLQANPNLHQLAAVQDLKQALQAHLFAEKPLPQEALITLKTQVCEAEVPDSKQPAQPASQLQPLYPNKSNQP